MKEKRILLIVFLFILFIYFGKGVVGETPCTSAGGNSIDSICRFESSLCPSNWIQIQDWSTTSSNTCEGGDQWCGGSCATESHVWSNKAAEICTYSTAYNIGNDCGSDTADCQAQITQIGCLSLSCGNNVIDGTEQCDGTNFNSQTCQSQGFLRGTLLCNSDCTLNTNRCTSSDTKSPVISDIQSTTTKDSATITWKTDEDSDSLIGYSQLISRVDTNEDIEIVPSPNNLVKIHQIIIPNSLASDQTYYHMVYSKDASGNLAKSSVESFKTKEDSDLNIAPQVTIISPVSGSTVSTTFNLEVTTNKYAQCRWSQSSLIFTSIPFANELSAIDGLTFNSQMQLPDGLQNLYVSCKTTSALGESSNPVQTTFTVLTSLTSFCGNGIIEGTEQCDTLNLNGQICPSMGFSGGGTLSCDSDCTFNTNQCIVLPEINNLKISAYGSNILLSWKYNAYGSYGSYGDNINTFAVKITGNAILDNLKDFFKKIGDFFTNLFKPSQVGLLLENKFKIYRNNELISKDKVSEYCNDNNCKYEDKNLNPGTYNYNVEILNNDESESKSYNFNSVSIQKLPEPCKDECSQNELRQCSSAYGSYGGYGLYGADGYRTCGNYDSDSCLEWSTVNSCNTGEKCEGGNCILTCIENWKCSAWSSCINNQQ
ncbi:MAG: hypothetical protein AABX61_03870, partial [Nanoarchaeota archaeon]